MYNKLLLLSCCAPCSVAVIEKMAQEGANFSVLFYNPNIKPFEEYQKRLEENRKVCKFYGIDFIDLDYEDEIWNKMTKGLENEPERGSRCNVCFYMRIKKALEYAKENGFTAVSSVLASSRYKDLNQVNEMAQKASKAVDFPYVEVELRKGGLQVRAFELVKELGLYHQNYCGCKPR